MAKTSTKTSTKSAPKTTTAMSALASALKRWNVKAMGTKPTQALIEQSGSFLKRTGTGKHLALAMFMRDGGATQTEIIHATGDTQINCYYEAVRSETLASVDSNPARGGHKVYALALPVKKAKAPRKARAAKKPATKPTADQPETPAS